MIKPLKMQKRKRKMLRTRLTDLSEKNGIANLNEK